MVPLCVLLSGSAILFRKTRTLGSMLQVAGAACLVSVVITHFCEALHLLPWMHWGDRHRVGHYLDLASAVLGLTLFPVGDLLDVLAKWHV
jgi:hypothetical protein